ncbi:MAG: hypothetical protein ACYTET_01240 [Planctomycetota bacterium]
MEWWKILAWIIAVGYVVFAGLTLFGGEDELSAEDVFNTFAAVVGLLMISLGCIFYGQELGDGLIGARFGLVSSASPGWAVQLMGWIFLFAPAVYGLYLYLNVESV